MKSDLVSHILRAGGIVSTADLRRAGFTDRDLTAASRGGEVRRLRRGWYSALPACDPRAIAVAAGGRLTAPAAIAAAQRECRGRLICCGHCERQQ